MLGICHPGPEFDCWLDLGFCASQDEAEEGFLDYTYQMLASYCSYDEFFTAYANSTIIQLLDTRGLRGRRIIHPYLEDVLSGSPVVFKSVWTLKQYLEQSRRGQSDLPPSVEVDYGFINCTTDSERQDLKDLYTNIFQKTLRQSSTAARSLRVRLAIRVRGGVVSGDEEKEKQGQEIPETPAEYVSTSQS
ncbi:MYND-type domain-containing protein [Mycena sanguinolenta]|uniref:MYND-type domain-containing protein n=1 Tax=Mycena sanguinolenta TaxID=230812 RepID=A0A8H7CXK2_9AGAR|nr:MYND-type domain-containing protein [Mycena sanguinolenta]